MKLKFIALTIVLGSGLSLMSCGGDDSKKDESGSEGKGEKIDMGNKDQRDKLVGTNMEATVGEYRFSVPSPVQMSKIIKESGATFDESFVNSHENAANYSTTFQKALNLGVYGADLGYLTMYGITNDAMSYLAAINSLSKDLQIDGAFDEALVKRFADNMENLGNEDSLQKMVSEAYRAGNKFLQNEKRYDVIGLLLTGGYIESLYFACEVAKSTNDQNVMNSIGGQKATLSNLVSMLNDVNSKKPDDQIESLVKQMIDLENSFNNIEKEYIYRKSEHKADEHLTIIRSSSNVKFTEEQLAEIIEKVEGIRASITE